MIAGHEQGARGINRGAVSSHPWNTLVLCLLLFGLVLWTFLPSLRNGFVSYDDPRYIMDNSHVRSGLKWENIRWAFTATASSNWHPVTWLSHMADCQLFGLNPAGHHATSVLLHAMNAVLVFVVLRRMTGAVWRSLLVACLFGLHPLRVESVAWAAERKDVLSGFFFLLTLLAYARYAQKKSEFKIQKSQVQGPRVKVQSPTSNIEGARGRTWCLGPWTLDYCLALVLFALGLMSKPMLVTLPLVLLLVDDWPLGRLTRRSLPSLVLEKIPFFLLSAASCVITFNAQRGAMLWMAHVPFRDRAANAAVACWRYLGALFWPAKLSCLYPLTHWSALTVTLAAGSLLAVSALAVVLRRRAGYLTSGWFWFLGTLVPVIGLVAVGEQSMADRYTYIPSIGALLALAWGAHDVTRRRPWQASALSVAAAAAVLACIPVTRQNLSYWRNTETLFGHALQTTQGNYRAAVNLGGALFQQGRVGEALDCFQKAVQFKPDSAEAHSDVGVALHALDRPAEAISAQREALRLRPDFAEAHFNLGLLLEEAGQLEESILEYRAAAGLNREPVIYEHLGTALVQSGRADEAVTVLLQLLELKPRDAGALVLLGEALRQEGRVEEAAARFKEALEIDPANTSARTNLSLLLPQERR